MSRFAVALSSSAGAVAGGVIGVFAGPLVAERMDPDDASLAAGAIGAVIGAAILAGVSASKCETQTGVGEPPKLHNPRFP